ncbi:MAG: hypothetical protein ACXAEU_04830 [Candidatus Hodarchaeales archaeon]
MSEISTSIKKKDKNKEIFSIENSVERPLVLRKKSDLLCELLEEKGPLSRGEIVTLSGIAWTTTYDTLVKLEYRGRVHRFSQRSRRGRPKVFWRINDF